MATVKLGEKPIVEALGDSDHVIVEIGGNIRRVPAKTLISAVPVIDLASLGVVLGIEQNQYFDIPEDISEQIQQAAMSGGAVIKIGYVLEGWPIPIQSYFNGTGSSALNMYQLRSKFWLGETTSAYLSIGSNKLELQVTLLPEGTAKIDLTGERVVLDPDKPSQKFSISVDVWDQIAKAAMTGAATVRVNLSADSEVIPVQAYCTGAAIESQKLYQLSCKIYFNVWLSMAIVLNAETSTTLYLFISKDQAVPAPGLEGDFLRVAGGEWVSETVPAAEEASF